MTDLEEFHAERASALLAPPHCDEASAVGVLDPSSQIHESPLREEARSPAASEMASPQSPSLGGVESGARSPLSRSRSLERVGWTLAGITLLIASVEVWTGSTLVSWILPISLVGVSVGFWTIGAAWARPRVPRSTEWALVMAALVVFAARAYLSVLGSPSYGTDELAFDQYAAMLLVHGTNPYLHSMAQAFELFHVPNIYWTYTLSGGRVTALSYPAGAFLPYVPGLLLGWRTQEAVVIDTGAWILGGLLAWRLMDRHLRWAGIIAFLGISFYLGLAVGGVTDALYMPFLVVALWRWDRFSSETGWRRWCGPIALGLACSVKQLPWFLVPLLLIAVWKEAGPRGRRPLSEVVRYAGAVALPVVLVDIPFAIGHPTAWLHDVLTPLLAPTVPGGQGLVGLTTLLHLGGRLEWFSYVGVAAVVVTWLALAGWYRQMKPLLILLVGIVFFFASRSFSSYLAILLPAGLVAATTISPAPRGSETRRARPLAGGLALCGLGTLVLALILPAPLRLRIVSLGSTGQLQSIDRLEVVVHNTTDAPLRPHYTITPTGQETSFWQVVAGPRTLGPHQWARVELVAPNTESMPSLQGAFIVDAFTAKPASLSTAPSVHPDILSTWLTPDNFSQAIPLRRRIVFKVQVVNRLDAPVHRSGMLVDLGQVVYAQDAIEPGLSSINGQSEGRTPVSSRTNADGVATFIVEGIQTTGSPTFFQAWLVTPGKFPSGYSNLVSVRFRSRS